MASLGWTLHCLMANLCENYPHLAIFVQLTLSKIGV